MLSRVKTNDKAWDIHNLLANSNVPLSNQNAGMMDALGETEFEDWRGRLIG